jgi:hypothetical protein
MKPNIQIDFKKEMAEKLTVHTNLGQEVVVTTVDKLRLCLIQNRDYLTIKREWLTPLGIFLTLLTTLVAADFRQFIFKADVWVAIYVIGALTSFVWFGSSAYKAWDNRGRGSIDDIVEELKPKDMESDQGKV